MFKKLFLVFLLIIIVIIASCGPLPAIETVDSYMIAYVEIAGNIRIRYAGEDPTADWIDGGALEGGAIPLTAQPENLGTGLGSYPQGAIAVLGTLAGNKIDLRLGIGPFFSKDPDDTLSTTALSTPSIAHIDGTEYMIAYQYFDPFGNLLNGRLAVIPWDASHSSVISEDAGQMPSLIGNLFPYADYLVGRPAITYLKEKELLLVVWNREGATIENPLSVQSTTQYALGTYPSTDNSENAIVNWTRYGIIDVLEWGESIVASPSLATDGENFYLGIPYGVSEADVGTSFWVAVYKSMDGLHWTRIVEHQCPNPMYYADIAVQSNGDMLVGCFGYNKQDFYLFRDGAWTDLDAIKVLGGIPKTTGDNKHDFAIETFKLQVN